MSPKHHIKRYKQQKSNVKPKKFSKNYNCNPFYLLQVRSTVPSFVFAGSVKPCFERSAFTQFDGSLYWWVLINFVTQLLGLFTDRSNSFSYPFIYSKWNPYTFSYTSSLKKVLFSDGDSPPPPPESSRSLPLPGSRHRTKCGGESEKGRGLIWIRRSCRRKKKWKEEMA